MRALLLLAVSILAPSAGLAVPLADNSLSTRAPRENLCSLKQPPELCKPDPSVTVEETAQRAYEFYKAFVVDGDPRKMFSLIDSTYKQHHAGYADGPGAIWSLFCNGRPAGTAANSKWCFDASTNMSYAQYGVTDRWRWVDGCVHEHWDQGERIPADKCYKLNTTSLV
ncbi:uncharacterized protein E0L32_003171 [Thyridium curvatum]|uniref:Uncharacterized protein n=1 Tax=Thyridium curvatum TaxID=1093900 RepID=A0A507BLH7_9PEZI|nr:uncharacterized protein E0L32_003171 [Thyridium curvatum]TPX17528.1 hypothetical protein E0L32_003171 [Thyridium curvatum]